MDCCGSIRCTQNRRITKKDLSSWSKKMPYLIGMEHVAEMVCGRTLMSLLLHPYRENEKRIPKDFDPDDDSCMFCNGKTEETRKATFDHLIEETKGPSYRDSVLPLPYSTTLSPHPPLPPPVPHLPSDHSRLDPSFMLLDAQYNTSLLASHSIDPAKVPASNIELKVPQLSKKRRDGSIYKKSYTDDELSQAMNDIRTGKLGTRRAAALYGIPRSTLRNKLFKQQSNSRSESPALRPDMCADKTLPLPNLSMSDLLQSMASTSGYMHKPMAVLEDDKESLNGKEPDTWEERLEVLRKKHNLDRSDQQFGLPMPFGQFGGFPPYNPFALSSYLSTIPLPSPAPETAKESNNGVLQENGSLDLSMPKTNDDRKSVDLKIPCFVPSINNSTSSAKDGENDSCSTTSDDAKSMPNNGSVWPENPGWSHDTMANGSKVIGDKLKDIIAKTIAEKVKGRTTPQPISGSENGHSDEEKSLTNGQSNNNDDEFKSLSVLNGTESKADLPTPPKRTKLQKSKTQSSSTTNGDSSTSESTDGKKTRPKRGQYRRYNSQLLVEAVKAVQRGEMSVHRAGSYYGVPHSTLEYKVKERHLLRQKKPREPKKKPDPPGANMLNGLDKKVPFNGAVLNTPLLGNTPLMNGNLTNFGGLLPSQEDISANFASLAHLQQMSALTSMAPFAAPLGAWAGFPSMPMGSVLNDAYPPLLPSGFAPNTSASDLLKSLQKKAESNHPPGVSTGKENTGSSDGHSSDTQSDKDGDECDGPLEVDDVEPMSPDRESSEVRSPGSIEQVTPLLATPQPLMTEIIGK